MSSLVLSTFLLLLRFLCRLPGRLILFILIGAWNATVADHRRCSTKPACCFFPSSCASCAPMVLRATSNLSGIDNDDFVAILVKRVTCLLKCYDQWLAVCEKPLLNAWNRVMMLENGILPRKHACLKLSDDPGNFRSRHSPLGEDTRITQIEDLPCIFSSLFCCSWFWSNRLIENGFCVLAMVKNSSANCL